MKCQIDGKTCFRPGFPELALVSILLGTSSMLRAETYYVATTGNDNAAGTESAPLASLSVALAKEDVTEVRIAAGDYDAMQTMTSTIANSTGTDWLGVVSTGVRIVGAGADTTILRCHNPVNTARGGIILNHAEAMLSGVTVTGAFLENWNPQGIAVRVISGTMRDCVLTGNSVPSGKVKNNTILSLESASALAVDSKITDNDLGTNSRAAAVTVGANARIERCTIARNKSGDATSVNGLSLGMSAVAVDCVISENSGYNTGISGGGVYMGGYSQLIGCVVSNNVNNSRYQNSATTISAGGVYVSNSACLVSNCTIVGNCNYCSYGINAGGLALATGATNCRIIDTTIANNFTSNGAEVYLPKSALTHCTVRNNRGAALVDASAGGAVGDDCTLDDGSQLPDERPAVCYVSTTGSATAPYDTEETATSDLKAAVDAVRRGGKVVVAPGTYNNTSTAVEYKYGTKFHVLVDKAVTIEGPADASTATFLYDTVATVKTGCAGIWMAHPEASLSGITLTCSAMPADTWQYAAMGLQLDAGIVSNCVVTGCREASKTGSHCQPPVVIDGGRMVCSSIRDNNHTSGKWGRGSAGLVIDAGSFEHGEVLRNGFPTANADQAEANGIFIRGGTVSDTIIEGNYGGANRKETSSGVKMTAGTLARCIVQCNTNNAGTAGNQTYHAGGIYASGSSTIENCLIAGNKALTTAATSAGGLWVADSSVVVRHVTLTANSSASGDGGAYLANGSVMTASIASGNTGTQVTCGPNTDTAEVWTTGVSFGNDTEPLPVDWETAASYAITSSSAGYNAVTTNRVETDLLGVVRPVVGAKPDDFPDAGAMEKVGPKAGEIVASVLPSSAYIPLGESQPFAVSLDGDDTTVASCTWKIVFEDKTNEVTVASDAYTFRPDKPGRYTLIVAVSNSSGKTAPDKEMSVTVAPFVCYVATDGGNVYPYDTEEKAARDIGSAVSAVYGVEGRPGTVYVAAGDYSGMSEMTAGNSYTYVAALEKPVRLIAPDGPAKTTIRYTSTDLGGCLYLAHAEAVACGFTLSGSTKTDNDTRWSGFGNAVSLMNGTVSNCVMTGCSVTGTHIIPTLLVAGGLAADCAVTNNNLGSRWGRGALGVVVSGGVLTNSVIAGNNQKAASYDLLQAGGVYMSAGCVTGCRISGNFGARNQASAGGFSAGVFMAGGTLDHTLIDGNTDCCVNAATYNGSGLLLNSSSAVADHVTVVGNVSSNAACSYAAVNAKAGALKNSIIWGNDATDLLAGGGAVTYSCWSGAQDGDGNISDNPGLVDNWRHLYEIRATSPCARKGENGTYMGYAAPFPGGLIFKLK